ncbi:hypothetical protein [Methylomonas koyamae]|uniref:hypothetical protein n=1 Tax=Methylomonas koyamae TaxID=702114 RepID=UPI0028735C6B|nr:hypothetical protein [Methylomonas koyamae]WNB77006.1 hypothetical protein RI210_05395 [Methylomonas koyamae]
MVSVYGMSFARPNTAATGRSMLQDKRVLVKRNAGMLSVFGGGGFGFAGLVFGDLGLRFAGLGLESLSRRVF